MSYSVLRTLKKEDEKKIEKKFVRHLIIGDDVFAVELALKLKSHNPEGGVGLLVEKKFETSHLLPKGASTLRGETNIQVIKDLYPDAITTEYDRVARFIKEGKFKKFGGRSKPETLLWGENFYVSPRIDVDLLKIFPFLSDTELYSKLPTLEEKIKGIAKAKSDDLVQSAKWAVECASGTTYECEHLYFANGPAAFLNLIQNKSEASSDFIEWCESTQTPATLCHHWRFSKPVIDRTDTIFLPFSYTHEWGHAIVEFAALDNGAQEARMTCFIEPDQTNEEDLAKKIRLYKRNLEKICPEVIKFSSEEFLSLSPNSVCEKIDDTAFIGCRGSAENVHFVSMQAAFEDFSGDRGSYEDSSLALSHMARGLLKMRTSALNS